MPKDNDNEDVDDDDDDNKHNNVDDAAAAADNDNYDGNNSDTKRLNSRIVSLIYCALNYLKHARSHVTTSTMRVSHVPQVSSTSLCKGTELKSHLVSVIHQLNL